MEALYCIAVEKSHGWDDENDGIELILIIVTAYYRAMLAVQAFNAARHV